MFDDDAGSVKPVLRPIDQPDPFVPEEPVVLSAESRTGERLPWSIKTLATEMSQLVDAVTGEHARWTTDDYLKVTLLGEGACIWRGKTIDEDRLPEWKAEPRRTRSEFSPTLPGAFVLVNHVNPRVLEKLSFNEQLVGSRATGKNSIYRLAGNFAEQDHGTQYEQAERIVSAFERLGCEPSVVCHSGGKSLHTQVLYARALERTNENLRRWGHANAVLAQLLQGDPKIAVRIAHRVRLPGYVASSSADRHQPILWLADRVDPDEFLDAASRIELTDELLLERYQNFLHNDCGVRVAGRPKAAESPKPASPGGGSAKPPRGRRDRESAFGGALDLDLVVKAPGWGRRRVRDLHVAEGAKITVCCPHHDDRRPSAFVGRGSRVGLFLSCPHVCGKTWYQQPAFKDVFPEGIRFTGFPESVPTRGADDPRLYKREDAAACPSGQHLLAAPVRNGDVVPLADAEAALDRLAEAARGRQADTERALADFVALDERQPREREALKAQHAAKLQDLKAEYEAADSETRATLGERNAQILEAQTEEVRALHVEHARQREEAQASIFGHVGLASVRDGSPTPCLIYKRYLDPLPLEPGVTHVKSEKNTGKTTALADAIRDAQSVLVVSPRKTLVRQYAERFGLTFYKDVDRRLIEARKVSVTLDSVGRIRVFGNEDGTVSPTKWRQFDLVVLDESELLLRHFFGGTLKERAGAAYEHLRTLVQNAKRVVCLDADLSDLTIKAVRAMRGRVGPERFIENLCVPGDVRYLLFGSKGELLTRCLELLRDGKKLYVASSSKRLTRALEEQIASDPELAEEELRVRVYNSETSGEYEDELADLNKAVMQFDLVIASPSLTSGVSIDVDHFDHVVLFADGGALPATDLLQLAGRVRNPRSKTILAWIDARKRDAETDRALIERDFRIRSDWMDAEVGCHYRTGQDGRPERVPYDEDFLHLYCATRSLERRGTNDLYRAFTAELDARGTPYLVALMPEVGVAKVVKAYNEAAERVEHARAEQIADAPDISVAEAEEILKRSAQAKERDAATKAMIKDYYGQEVDADLVLLDDEGRYRRKVDAFAAYRVAAEGRVDNLREADLPSYRLGARVLVTMDTHRGVLLHKILASFGIERPIYEWQGRIGVRKIKGTRYVLSGLGRDVRDVTEGVQAWQGMRRKLQELLGPLHADARWNPIGFLEEVLGSMDVSLAKPDRVPQDDGSILYAQQVDAESVANIMSLSQRQYERYSGTRRDQSSHDARRVS